MEPNSSQPVSPEQFPAPAVAILPEATLERVHRKLRTCQHLLATPSASAMLACGTCMGEVRFELESLTGALQAAPPETRAGLRDRVIAVVEEFRHASRLLESANTLYQGWTHVLAAHVRGYTRNGTPAALRYGSDTLLRG